MGRSKLSMCAALVMSFSGMALAQSESTVPENAPNELGAPGPRGGASGASTGEGLSNNPAGIPADPTTEQNQQPGPSVANPTDPAAGSDPAARVPTDPEKR